MKRIINRREKILRKMKYFIFFWLIKKRIKTQAQRRMMLERLLWKNKIIIKIRRKKEVFNKWKISFFLLIFFSERHFAKNKRIRGFEISKGWKEKFSLIFTQRTAPPTFLEKLGKKGIKLKRKIEKNNKKENFLKSDSLIWEKIKNKKKPGR